MYELQNIATGETASIGVGRYVIGRDQAQCQIFLDEPFISRLQAAIEVSINGQAAIKNLSNKMTTFVNGQVIDVVILRDGDRIRCLRLRQIDADGCAQRNAAGDQRTSFCK